jgi:hypothetical protein
MFRNFTPHIAGTDAVRFFEIETETQKPKRMNLLNRAFIVQEDPDGFNQIKGRKIVGLFRDNELYRVSGFNDSETVYFIRDGDDVTGANKLKSTDVVILIEDRKAQEVTHIGNPEGEMIPPNEFSADELTLLGFKWQIQMKPVDRDDIYEWREDAEQPSGGARERSSSSPASAPSTNDARERPSGTRPTPSTNDAREKSESTRPAPANTPRERMTPTQR